MLAAHVRQAHGGFGLPHDPDDVPFAESTPFHGGAPMPGTLPFQWTCFLRKGQQANAKVKSH